MGICLVIPYINMYSTYVSFCSSYNMMWPRGLIMVARHLFSYYVGLLYGFGIFKMT